MFGDGAFSELSFTDKVTSLEKIWALINYIIRIISFKFIVDERLAIVVEKIDNQGVYVSTWLFDVQLFDYDLTVWSGQICMSWSFTFIFTNDFYLTLMDTSVLWSAASGLCWRHLGHPICMTTRSFQITDVILAKIQMLGVLPPGEVNRQLVVPSRLAFSCFSSRVM